MNALFKHIETFYAKKQYWKSENPQHQLLLLKTHISIQQQKCLTSFRVHTLDLTAIDWVETFFFSFSSTWISSVPMAMSESDSGRETRDCTSRPESVNSSYEPRPTQRPCNKTNVTWKTVADKFWRGQQDSKVRRTRKKLVKGQFDYQTAFFF